MFEVILNKTCKHNIVYCNIIMFVDLIFIFISLRRPRKWSLAQSYKVCKITLYFYMVYNEIIQEKNNI